MNLIRLEYKRETGNRPEADIDMFGLYNEDYVVFLESKVTELQKELDTIKDYHNYKQDFEEAEYEIGQLQDQLENAEDEIRELNRQIQ